MIETTESRNKALEQRIYFRSAVNSFKQIITSGTNCSPFEASVISDKAQQVFHLGEHTEYSKLQPGQIVWRAISSEEPPGKELRFCVYKQIYLTVHSLEEDRAVMSSHGRSAKRGQQILRMSSEACDQGTYLTQEDLAEILDCDVKTIRDDIKRYQNKHGILVPTRGNKKDIGRGITHREKAVELFIQGKDALSISRDMKHSLKAVERYIQTFCRVIYCQSEIQNSLKTAMVVGVSVALVNKYFALKNKYMKTKAYRERLQEIEEVGSKFWEYQDSKKKPGRTQRRER